MPNPNPKIVNPKSNEITFNQGNEFSQLPSSSTTAPNKQARDMLRIFEWNMHFYGDDRDKVSIENFLYRVENMALVNGIPYDRLANNFSVLLKDQALNWYWNYRQSNNLLSWSDLKPNIIRRFRMRRSDADIKYDLERTRQKFKESFFDFYDNIQNKALKLQTPLSDQETINLLMRNMRPGLQDKFAGQRFTNLIEFIDMCVLVEDDWIRIGHVPELSMSKRHVSEINVEKVYAEDELRDNYLSESNNYSVNAFKEQNKPSEFINTSYADLNRTNKLICWNCRKLGHPFPECPVTERNVFCYGCGAPGILKPDCPYCSRKENQFRESKRTGGLNSQISMPRTRQETTETASNTDPELYRLLKRLPQESQQTPARRND